MAAFIESAEDPDPACLDTETGAVVRQSECDPAEVGDGPSALAAGKRFVRVPRLSGVAEQYVEQAITETGRMLGLKQIGGKEAEDRLRYKEIEAAQRVALEWLASLNPPFRIEWYEGTSSGEGGPLRFVYNPSAGRWHRI